MPICFTNYFLIVQNHTNQSDKIDSDKLVMQISNNGELSEHVGVKIYLQETDYFTEFKSMVIGNDSRKSSDVKAAYKPFEPSKTEGKINEMKYIYIHILII